MRTSFCKLPSRIRRVSRPFQEVFSMFELAFMSTELAQPISFGFAWRELRAERH